MKAVYDYALSMLGNFYRWGGDDPSGFDCSGLVQELLKAAGGHPNQKQDYTAQGLFDHFDKLGGWGVFKFGSLVWYGKTVTSITHVAFMMDDRFVITASGGGSKTLTVQDAIRDNAFIKIRPVDYRKDRVAVIWPGYPGYF